ncbi:sensor histidine kinase [Halonotius roseus]|uniref:histidine kinase n=1 Tax=Halonotius roseus TaxID=2511997 RepID=A0A544QQ20_9EURY|nr:HAMP domain-containing sensor histidine kinase [Halonotius roseus]TQQ81543.1 HAMP domain-containing histidine kinase [Halonotius roseus]
MDGASDPSEATPLPPDALPVPIVGVDQQDDAGVITTVNDAFAARFGDAAGTAVDAWVDAHAASTASSTAIDDAVAVLRGDAAGDVQLRLQPAGEGDCDVACYRFQPIDRPTAELTYTVVTPREATPSVAVDRLASVISHDLRNPLDVADAHLQAARETGDPEHFEQLAAVHDRMARIIQDVLTLARGEDALNPVTGVDLAAVVADAWATVDTEAASLSIDDELPTLAADPDRLQRLFENLFRNSVEHGSTSSRTESDDSVEHGSTGSRSQTGDDTLTVTVGRVGDGFFVADDGVGIPADDRQQVFDSGYVRDDSGLGTGLGLTIVEEIADAHEWSVSLTDSEAGGARFEFHPREEPSTT